MKYRNIITGEVVEFKSTISSPNFQPIVEKAEPQKVEDKPEPIKRKRSAKK
jgi:hypothetical protein